MKRYQKSVKMHDGFWQFVRDLPSKHRGMFMIILAYSIFSLGGALYWAAIPILSQQVFLLSPFYIGLVMASIGVVYILSDEPIGVLLDYVGYKTGFVIGIISAGITALIAISQPPFWLFLVGIVFFALAWNITTVSAGAYILYSVPKNVEGKIFGTYDSLYKLGVFISTFFIAYIAQWGFVKVGLFFLLMVLIALLLGIVFLKSEKRKYDHNFFHAVKTYWHAPSQLKKSFATMKEFSPISWVMAFDGFVDYLISSTLFFAIPLSLVFFANPFVTEGIALGIFQVTGIFFGAIGGYLADKYSKKKLFLGLLFIMGIAMIALGFAPNLGIFLILAFITAAASDTATAPLDAMLAEIDKKHDKDGTIMGTLGLFTDLGFIVGPIVSSFLLTKFGLKGIFLFLGIVLFIDWTIAAILLRKYKGRPIRKMRRRVNVSLGGIAGNHRKKVTS